MNTEKYGLHSEFDIQKHSETFVDYLEVIIDEAGKVHYAVPSHQEYLILYACKKLNVSREQLYKMCRDDYGLDTLYWLCQVTKCIAVWNNYILYASINDAQRDTIESLKLAKLYCGDLPE